jgi:hypothetical protein
LKLRRQTVSQAFQGGAEGSVIEFQRDGGRHADEVVSVTIRERHTVRDW